MIVQPPVMTLSPGQGTGATMSITTAPDLNDYPIMCSDWSNAGPSEPSAVAARFTPVLQPTGDMQVIVAHEGDTSVVGKLDVYMPLTNGNWMIGGPWNTTQIGNMIVPDGVWLGPGSYDVVMA